MRKVDYIEMLKQENNDETTKELYEEVIMCLEMGLSVVPDDFEITDTSLGLKELYGKIEGVAKAERKYCIGSAEASRILAKVFNVDWNKNEPKVESSRDVIVDLANFI